MWATMAFAAVAALAAPQQDVPFADRIYGTVTTDDGDTYEGFIRWTDNEGSWSDFLNGNKRLDPEHLEEARAMSGEEPRRGFSIFGINISFGDDGPDQAMAGLRFGHIASIERGRGGRAEIRLLSGELVELDGGSSDLGSGMEMLVEDPVRGTVELDWGDLERVEFHPAPADAQPLAQRLYGTAPSRRRKDASSRASSPGTPMRF